MYMTKSINFHTDHAKLSEVIESFEGYPSWNTLVRSLRVTDGGPVRQGAKVKGTLVLGRKERTMNGRITSYGRHQQMVLNFTSLLYRITIEYTVQWETPGGKTSEGVPEGPSDVTVTLGFNSESGMPLVGEWLDRFSQSDVSEETLSASLQGLKAHSELPSTA